MSRATRDPAGARNRADRTASRFSSIVSSARCSRCPDPLDARIGCRRQRAQRVISTAVSAFDEALVVIYRILFLLFAEARGLVPRWHPIYRDAYTIESLRGPVETLPAPIGVWETLQAIARLAHRGCRIGSLYVPPFNGRLFSPVHAPLADSVPLDDRVVRLALLALTTRTGAGRMSAHRLRRSWRRAARRRLRTAAGFRSGRQRGPNARAWCARPWRASQIHRRLLHSQAADGVSRASGPRATRGHRLARINSGVAHPGSCDGQRGVPGRRVPIPGRGVRGSPRQGRRRVD